MTLLRGTRLSLLFFLLHSACFAAHVSALVVLFRFGLWKADGFNSWILLAASLLVLQLLISSVCCVATWGEFAGRAGTTPRPCVLLPLALPMLGLVQLIQPWLAWKELTAEVQPRAPQGQAVQRHAQLHRGRTMITAAPRFSCSGVEAVVQGSAFAAVALWSLTWALWQRPGSCEMKLQSRAVLWTCAGLSLLSACLGLVEMDLTLSDTAAASLTARPGRAFPLHFGLRALEVCSRIWVWTVLASLLSEQSLLAGGVPVFPLILLLDFCLTACTFLGGHGACKWIWLLALGSMMANLMKFVDASAWSIRARKVTRRLAWLRHLELLAAMLGAGMWMVGLWSSEPRHGPVQSWKELQLFLADGRNSLLLLGFASVLLYHLMSFSLAQLHVAQVRADGLHRAAARGDAEALSRLLRDLERSEASTCPRSTARSLLVAANGINAPNADGWTALHLAAATPHAERGLRVLLRAQAEVSPAHPVRGMTPLMLSAEAGMDKALRMLLSSGASQALQQSNHEGNSALHLAVREGHSECIHRLLRARADPSATNAQGFTAFDFTRSQKFTESLLQQSQLSQSAFFEVVKEARSELRTSLGEDSLPGSHDPFQFQGAEPSSRGPLLTTPPREVTPQATPRPSASSPTVTVRSVRSGVSGVLDVPVLTAPESALDELLAEASRGGALRFSHVSHPAASVLTEGTSRSSPSRSPLARQAAPQPGARSVKITGLASLVAVASPGALRRLAAGAARRPGRSVMGSAVSSDSEKDYKLSSFRIVGLIGEGSFGSVYEACDLRPGAAERRCALKILHRRQYLAQDMLARAKQERQVLKAARHPFIVRLLCAFRTPGNEMALVMEYCCNGNLNDLLLRCGRPGLGEGLVRRLLAEVLLALAYLHDELDVVFRDVKPENIVLDANMHAKLTDFGLAKVEASRGAGACSFVGSMYFVAPEVTPAACRYSPAVDIYALGLVAWVCLTGGRQPEMVQGSKDGPSQRLPPATHEALRSWLEQWRPPNPPAGSCRQLSELAFSFIDVTTSSEPLQRGTASQLRSHPFFTESRFSPPLSEPNDWVALLPSMEDEPTTPGSVATQDSWSWDARERLRR